MYVEVDHLVRGYNWNRTKCLFVYKADKNRILRGF